MAISHEKPTNAELGWLLCQSERELADGGSGRSFPEGALADTSDFESLGLVSRCNF